MRIVRLFSVLLTVITAGGWLLATPTGAQPPDKLTDHITDSTGVLTDTSRPAVSAAIDRLYRDRHIQLWVVYVDNFSRFKPDNWADRTRSASGMGDHDALLAVATNTKLYTFTVPKGLTADELNSLQRNNIEPAVGRKDWSGAAIAAADGLNTSASSSSSSTRNWLPIAIGVAIAVVALVVILLLLRARRQKAARRDDPGDGQANLDGPDLSPEQALSVADARLRQVSDYVAKHRQRIGTEAKARVDEAKRHLAAAHGKQASNAQEALAHANAASTLAAQAQELANADVLKAPRPRRRGTAATR